MSVIQQNILPKYMQHALEDQWVEGRVISSTVMNITVARAPFLLAEAHDISPKALFGHHLIHGRHTFACRHVTHISLLLSS